jgi:hypothetical protein
MILIPLISKLHNLQTNTASDSQQCRIFFSSQKVLAGSQAHSASVQLAAVFFPQRKRPG